MKGKTMAELTTEKEELQKLCGRLLTVFGHIHVSGELTGHRPDTCSECGLDIRNEVHSDKYA